MWYVFPAQAELGVLSASMKRDYKLRRCRRTGGLLVGPDGARRKAQIGVSGCSWGDTLLPDLLMVKQVKAEYVKVQ